MPKIRVIPVTGLPQFDGWSQVIELPAHSSVKTVMSIAVEGAHAGNVGRDIANFILAQTVETVESFYQLLEEIHAQALENEVRILLSAGFFLQGSCAYATLNGAVLLKRDAQVGVILSSGNTLQLITGKSTLQDVVVFSPLSSSHFFDEIKLKFEQGYDADTVVASVVPGIHGEANSSRSALAFVSFSPFSSEAVEQPPSESSTSRNFEERQSPLPAYRATPSRERIPLSPSRQTAYASAASISTTPEVQEAAAEAENREDSFISTLEDPIDTSSTTKPPVLSILGSVASGTGQFILTHLGRLARTAATGVRGSIPLVREAVLKLRSEKKQPSSVPVAEPISGSEQSLPAESWKSALRSLLPNRDVYIETSERKKAK